VLGFGLPRGQYARDFQKRARRRTAVVRADELNILEILGVVMARKDDDVSRFARELARHVHHFLLTLWRGRMEFVVRDGQTVGFQLIDNVAAGLLELGRTRRSRPKLNLPLHMVQRAVAVKV